MANQIKELSVTKKGDHYWVTCGIFNEKGEAIKLEYTAPISQSATQGLNTYLAGKAKADPRYNIPLAVRTQLADQISRRLAGNRTQAHAKGNYSKSNTGILSHSFSVVRSDSFFG
jgi:hypothetical protein